MKTIKTKPAVANTNKQRLMRGAKTTGIVVGGTALYVTIGALVTHGFNVLGEKMVSALTN